MDESEIEKEIAMWKNQDPLFKTMEMTSLDIERMQLINLEQDLKEKREMVDNGLWDENEFLNNLTDEEYQYYMKTTEDVSMLQASGKHDFTITQHDTSGKLEAWEDE